MILGGILEWVLGNSFPAVVFLTFGAYWLSFGGTLSPSFAAWSSFAAEGEPAASGLQAQGFNASLGKPKPPALSSCHYSHSESVLLIFI